MICQICGEENAVLHIQEILGDARTELHVCKRCAEAKGILRDIASLNLTLNASGPDKRKKARTKARVQCSRCGLTGTEYQKDYHAGCPQCYTDLAPVIMSAIKELQPGVAHTGRTPREPGNSAAEILRLKSELIQLIKKEDYERAATVRDAIDALTRPDTR